MTSTMKCTKVKNPCKICFQTVTKKNGLQCQGACRKWAHFKCLNYTPGKIQDIKAGIIKITCPSPDCSTSEPKEVSSDPPFTCTNIKCPANTLPICESIECPSKDSPIPTYLPLSSDCCDSTPVFTPLLLPYPPPCATSKQCPALPRCPPVNDCKLKIPPQPKVPPRRPPTPPKCPASPKCPPNPICPPPLLSDSPPSNCETPSPDKLPSSPPPCLPICPPTCPSNRNVKNGKKCCSPKQSQSVSNVSKNSNSSGKQQVERMRAISSDSKVPPTNETDQKLLFTVIENLSNTVGQLSTQLKDLLYRMQQDHK